MRIKLALLVLCVFGLAACAPAAAELPAELPSATTAAATQPPAATNTPEPPPTATPQVIPDFMKEYIERGFEARNTDEILCFVIEESKVHYSPLEGIKFKQRVIRSWLEVSYMQDGEYRQGIILEYVRREQPMFEKFVWSGSGAGGTNPSVAWVQSIHQGWADYASGEYPIFCGTLGLPANPETAFVPGVEKLYEGIFPVEGGKAQSVWIPEVGRVLPVTQCFWVDEPK